MSWFWDSPSWQEYSDSYGSGHAGNDSGDNIIVPLRAEADMLRAMSKGHRADIKRAEREGLRATVLYGGNFPEEMDEFRHLHAKAAGRVTRPLKTWHIQQRWIWDGVAALTYVGQPMIAAGLFIVYPPHPSVDFVPTIARDDVEKRSYYASAARDPNVAAYRGAGHLVIWETMKWLAGCGYTELDMGPRPSPEADGKAYNIAAFKRHFGAA